MRFNKMKPEPKNKPDDFLYVQSLERQVEDLSRELNRYKDIIKDIKKFDGLSAKTLEDIRDIRC